MAVTEALADHEVPADLLELYEVLEYFGKIKPPRSLTTPLRDTVRRFGSILSTGPLLPENFVSRAAWGARAPRSKQSLSGTLGNTIHYEGPHIGDYPHSSCATKVRGIQAFHMDTRQWVDIAYSSLTCRHGYIYECRWFGVRTAAQGTNPGNDDSYAHCSLMGVDDDLTVETKRGIRSVINYFQDRGSGTQRWGHRDWHSTACPGEPLYAWHLAGMPVNNPAPPPPPDIPTTFQNYEEDDVQTALATFTVGKADVGPTAGMGWKKVSPGLGRAPKIVGVAINGTNPPVNGYIQGLPVAGAAVYGNDIIVQIVGGSPGATYGVNVSYA